jgi:pimeloyl-ACP methyl ester carboxylesterase
MGILLIRRRGRQILNLVLGALILLIVVMGAFRWSANAREVMLFSAELRHDGRFVNTSEGVFYLLRAVEPENRQVLFAHGTATWSGLWRPTLESTASAEFFATAFDMPPSGWSEHPVGNDYSLPKQAKRVISLLEALGTQPIMVAHSFGAGPVVEAVMRRPDLVSGLVIVGGAIALGSHDDPKSLPVLLRNSTFREYVTAVTATNPYLTGWFLRRFIHVKEAETSELIALLQEPMKRKGYTNALNNWLPQLFETPLDAVSIRPESWRALDLPVALIWGKEDTVTPPEHAEELAELVLDAGITMLAGVGHVPHIEAPKAFQTALIGALRDFSIPATGGIQE